jgi:Sec7-like guanine-nucleotide exchange factor
MIRVSLHASPTVRVAVKEFRASLSASVDYVADSLEIDDPNLSWRERITQGFQTLNDSPHIAAYTRLGEEMWRDINGFIEPMGRSAPRIGLFRKARPPR